MWISFKILSLCTCVSVYARARVTFVKHLFHFKACWKILKNFKTVYNQIFSKTHVRITWHFVLHSRSRASLPRRVFQRNRKYFQSDRGGGGGERGYFTDPQRSAGSGLAVSGCAPSYYPLVKSEMLFGSEITSAAARFETWGAELRARYIYMCMCVRDTELQRRDTRASRAFPFVRPSLSSADFHSDIRDDDECAPAG